MREGERDEQRREREVERVEKGDQEEIERQGERLLERV